MYSRDKIIEIIDEIREETNSIKPYLFIAQPRRSELETPAQTFRGQLNTHMDIDGFSSVFLDIYGELVDVARNYLIEEAIISDAKYLFFIGEDTVVPFDAFKKLHDTALKNPNSVVTGVYYYKAGGPMIVKREGKHLLIPNCDPGQIIDAHLTGMDCMLIPVSILKDLKEKEPEAPFCVVYNDANGFFLGEDNFFTYRLRKHNYKLLVNTDVQCLHMDLASGKYSAHPDVNLHNYRTNIPITTRLTIEDKMYLEQRWTSRLPKPKYNHETNNQIKELVVAAYNKNYDWISRLNDDVKVTVYKKGEKNNDNEIYIEKNVGRDVHTFFYHIYHKYDDLSDYTFFAQEFPFDHWKNITETINGDENDFKENSILNFDGYFGYYTCDENMFSCSVKRHELTKSTQLGDGLILISNKTGQPHHNWPIDIDYFWNLFFKTESPEQYEFIPAAHFGVTKEQIRKRPKEFYGLILNALEENHDAPWIIERLNPYIFNTKYEIK